MHFSLLEMTILAKPTFQKLRFRRTAHGWTRCIQAGTFELQAEAGCRSNLNSYRPASFSAYLQVLSILWRSRSAQTSHYLNHSEKISNENKGQKRETSRARVVVRATIQQATARIIFLFWLFGILLLSSHNSTRALTDLAAPPDLSMIQVSRQAWSI